MEKYLAYFAGYGPQYWMNIVEPTINGNCDGITVAEVDPDSGEMKIINQIHGIDSPATLVVSSDHKYLYATNELNNFKGLGLGGGVSAFRIDTASGDIKLINQISAAGSCSCYVSIDKENKYIFVANHGSYYYVSRYDIKDGEITPYALRDEGSVSVFRIREDGGVGKLVDHLILEGTGADPLMHGSSHPHSIIIDEKDRVLIQNKGGDNIYSAYFDRKKEKLEAKSIYYAGKGSSPRHALFVPDTDYALVVNEYDAHVNSFLLEEDGSLELISRLDTFDPNMVQECSLIATARPWSIDVQIHPNRKFVYSNNTQGLISLFYFDILDGSLELIKQFRVENQGMTRGLQIDPFGRFLTATGVTGEAAYIFSIDEDSGFLKESSSITLPTPTALRYVYPLKEN